MEEFEEETIYGKTCCKCAKYFQCFKLEIDTSVNCIKNLVRSLNSQDVSAEFVSFGHAFQVYCSDFLKFECLELFLNCLITRAREKLTKNVFNLSYFLCVVCGAVVKDPVTLKCGHTFSKQCISIGKKIGFDCLKCGETYSHAYLSQLKTNVMVSSLIEMFWKNVEVEHTSDCKDDHCTSFSATNANETDSPLDFYSTFLENPSPKDLAREGDILVSSEKYQKAVQFYLLCSVFDPYSVHVKRKALECFYASLLDCPTYHESCECDISMLRSFNNTTSQDYCLKCLRHTHLQESEERNYLVDVLSKFCSDIDKLTDDKFIQSKITSLQLEKKEFDCPLCMRILWEPITTPCGHTFCKDCLYRCFDHQLDCPLCKTDLASSFAERTRCTDEFVELFISSAFPDEYAKRKELYIEEMEELSNAGKDQDHFIPLFVCTTAFPTVPCPLHIFEPRYRLMIRQCMESGSRKFGMCSYIDNNIAEYGTLLEIKDVRYFRDGRAVVDTVGSNRFHVLKKGERDGYHTGSIEYLKDKEMFSPDLKKQHDHLYKTSQSWVKRLPQDTRHQVLLHFGPMPKVEPDCFSNPNGPSWFWWMLAILPVEPKSQVLILSMTSLAERLKALEKILVQLDAVVLS